MNNTSFNQRQWRDLRLDYYPKVVPVLTILCLLGIVANLYILISIKWLRKFPSPVMALTISLAASDLWVAFLNLVTLTLNSFLPFVLKIYFPVSFCFNISLELFRMGAMITAIMHLLSIALNHYAGCIRPLHYHAKMTRHVLVSLLLTLWIVPTAGCILVSMVIPGQGYASASCMSIDYLLSFNFRIVIFSLVAVPLIVMCGIYTHIWLIMQRRKRNSEVSESLHRSSTFTGPRGSRNYKAVVTTSLIIGTYIIGWMPGIIVFILICGENCPLNYRYMTINYPLEMLTLRVVVKTLLIVKTILNPIIYAARVHDIQIAIKRMHMSCCCNYDFVATMSGLDDDMMIRRSSISRAQQSNKVVSATSMETKRINLIPKKRQSVPLPKLAGGRSPLLPPPKKNTAHPTIGHEYYMSMYNGDCDETLL